MFRQSMNRKGFKRTDIKELLKRNQDIPFSVVLLYLQHSWYHFSLYCSSNSSHGKRSSQTNHLFLQKNQCLFQRFLFLHFHFILHQKTKLQMILKVLPIFVIITGTTSTTPSANITNSVLFEVTVLVASQTFPTMSSSEMLEIFLSSNFLVPHSFSLFIHWNREEGGISSECQPPPDSCPGKNLC